MNIKLGMITFSTTLRNSDRNGFFERKFQITKLRTNNSCFGFNSELQYILKSVNKKETKRLDKFSIGYIDTKNNI